jgi:hypothetical protein
MNKTLSIEQIRTRAAVEGITLYQIARILNDQLEKAGRTDLTVRPQMIYNYGKNGMVVKGLKGTDGYTLEQADAFDERFVKNRIAKNPAPAPTTEDSDQVHPDQLALEI